MTQYHVFAPSSPDSPAPSDAEVAAGRELNALFAAMTDIVVVIDKEGRYLQVPQTNAPARIARPADLVGRTLHELLPPERADLLLAPIQEALRERKTTKIEYSADIDGQEAWFSASISPMTADSVVIVARDITETRVAQIELERSQLRHLALLNSVDAILWEADADFSKFTFVSEQAERLLGYPVQFWLDDLKFWSDHIHPDDREWCMHYCVEQTDAGNDHDFEYRMITADGRTIWIRDIVTVVSEDGKPRHLRGVMIDITDLRQTMGRLVESEDQYRTVFESSMDGVNVSDPETGLTLAANPAFCRMHGWDDMVGTYPTDFIHPDSIPVLQQFRDTIMAGGEFRGRAQDVRKDGSVFDVEVYGCGFNYQGKLALLGVIRDISEQVRAELLLEQRVADRTQEIESLLGTARAVASTLDLRELVHTTLDQLGDVIEFNAASLVLSEEDTDFVEHDLLLPGDTGQSCFASGRNLSAGMKIHRDFWRSMRAGKPVVVDDESPLTAAYAAAVTELIEESPPMRMRSWLAVPLSVKDRIIGYMAMSSAQPCYFTDKHAQLVQAFADYAAVAIDNARLYERGQELAAVEERQRLARDLHDSVAQALYGIALGAKTARAYLDANPAQAIEPVDYVVSLAAAGLAEMRALIFDLHPDSIQREGLVNAINRQVNAVEARHGVSVHWTAPEEPDIPLQVKETVYAILREALHNVVKHAQASNVTIMLEASRTHVRFEVRDDGIGFDMSREMTGHMGLRSMRERAERLSGLISLTSAPERGTMVEGLLPIT